MADLKFDLFLIHTKKLESYNNILLNKASYSSKSGFIARNKVDLATKKKSVSVQVEDEYTNSNESTLDAHVYVNANANGNDNTTIKPSKASFIGRECGNTDRLIISNLLLQKLILSKFFNEK